MPTVLLSYCCDCTDSVANYGFSIFIYTAIPYRASTEPEQGFPCVVFPHREKPVFIAGFPVDENRFFPVGNTTQGNPCFHYRDGFAVCRYFKGTGSKLIFLIVNLF